ncbi:MAG: response regulator [Verrucomicrobia bacterium]|nr:response regulator [Verrucomicrobiota bacterium]MBU4247889.1 response regulator [Verrucomicrobiota bacterium]MBU4292253.1 response regulator [Verrucomicrobiota bacterium]MBU4427978.1 response regulator [Verrucomicrobiota bacterium]MBU4498031.1 response regulator [Verrucomicrobiota bacterium]
MKFNDIRILLIEDNPGDSRLIQEILHEENTGHWLLITADQLSHGLDKLATDNIDVVLLDLALPDSTGMDTLSRVQRQARQVAVIVLTGLNDNAMAIQSIHQGAQDYLVKGAFDRRMLVNSIQYSIVRKAALMEKDLLIAKQQQAINKTSALNGLLPICAHCKKIRDGQNSWYEMETFFQARTNIRFSHGICPACASAYYSELLSEPKISR